MLKIQMLDLRSSCTMGFHLTVHLKRMSESGLDEDRAPYKAELLVCTYALH